MSIAVLNQVYDETRRLAIAGSVVAGGDFRLKKLIPQLEQTGAKAPVFAKAAQAVTALVEANEQASAQALLDLCTLVTAVLYTQGETGLSGNLEPILRTDLGAQATQASARVLKPLLEALTTAGPGRLEIIRDAQQRGTFRDLRLVKPALAALDDAYPEIGDFVAEHVLPMYGKAILPELKAQLDIKGKGGHVRRLGLMHRLDPAGTRDTVKEALDSGSKEMKIAAIGCLGGDAEDLNFLLEESRAKAREVRAAALTALASMDSPEAVETLQKSLDSADRELAVHPIRRSRNPRLLQYVLAEAQREFDNICRLKRQSEISASDDRLTSLLFCLGERNDKATETFLLNCFARRKELLALPGGDVGTHLMSRLAALMADATPKTQQALATAHATLPPELFETVFAAACRSLSPTDVFEMFSPCLAEKPQKKSQTRYESRQIIIAAAISEDWSRRDGIQRTDGSKIEWDRRWLDVAVKHRHPELIYRLARPGHDGARKILSELFAAEFQKSRSLHNCDDPLWAMIRAEHPDAAKHLMAVLAKHAGVNSKYSWGVHGIARMIPNLPQSAAQELEALLPTLHEKTVDELLEAVQMLKNKT